MNLEAPFAEEGKGKKPAKPAKERKPQYSEEDSFFGKMLRKGDISGLAQEKIFDKIQELGVENPQKPTKNDFIHLAEILVAAGHEVKEFILGYYEIWSQTIIASQPAIINANEKNTELLKAIIDGNKLIIETLREELQRDLPPEARAVIYDMLERQSARLGEYIEEAGITAPILPPPPGPPVGFYIAVAIGVIAVTGGTALAIKDLKNDQSKIKGLLYDP